MKIKINKLFGRYDNVIDFNKKNNILIGENGIGKSTTIKMLNCLFKYNYIGLIEYYFDSIEIVDDDETILIKYDDLTLDKEYLLKNFCESWKYDYNLYVDLRKEYDKYKNNQNNMEIVFDDGKSNDTFYFVYPFDSFCNLLDILFSI